MIMDFDGRIVIIIGVFSGIGKVVVKFFIDWGVRVLVVGMSVECLVELV